MYIKDNLILLISKMRVILVIILDKTNYNNCDLLYYTKTIKIYKRRKNK